MTEWSDCMDQEAAEYAQAEAEQLRQENAELRTRLQNAEKKLAWHEQFILGVEAFHELTECSNCGAATFEGLVCGVCGHDTV